MKHTGQHHHHPEPAQRGLKRHHILLAGVALVLVLGWLAWNVLLVESDVGGAAVEVQSAGPAGGSAR